MPETLKDRVQGRLDALGIGAVAAATGAGLERTYIRDIVTGKKKTVSVDKLPKLAEALATTVEYLTFASDVPEQGAGERAKRPEHPAPDIDLSKAENAPPPRRFSGPRDVPVYGTAVGGGRGDGDFRFNGEQIDMAPRPPGIASRKGVYALYVENDSMYPRFEPGNRLYVDPHRKPRPGDDVIVELHSEIEGEAGPGFIKRLVKLTPTRVIVEQFNPPREIAFEARHVRTLHRVIPMDELLGI